MNLTRFGTRATAVIVAGVAGYSSYRHIYEVATAAGEVVSVAAVLPLSIDGLVVVASLAMLEDKKAGLQPRWSARVALGFGILMTLGFNLASAEPTWKARAVATVSAVSFLLAVEVLSRTGKPKGAHPVSTLPAPEPVQGVSTDTPLAEPLVADLPPVAGSLPAVWVGNAPNAERVRMVAGRLPATATLTEIAAAAQCSERTVRRYLPDDHPAKPGKTRTPEPVNATANGHRPAAPPDHGQDNDT